MSTALRVPHRMTVAEFQDWQPPGDLAQRRWELVDGEPVCMSPLSIDHGAIQGEVVGLIRSWLIANRPDCRVIVTPGVIPRIRSDVNERVPDLAVTCGPIRPARMLDDPILLIEILSPSNEAKTRANVWAYATIPSVHEIVLISSMSIAAEIFRRTLTALGRRIRCSSKTAPSSTSGASAWPFHFGPPTQRVALRNSVRA